MVMTSIFLPWGVRYRPIRVIQQVFIAEAISSEPPERGQTSW